MGSGKFFPFFRVAIVTAGGGDGDGNGDGKDGGDAGGNVDGDSKRW